MTDPFFKPTVMYLPKSVDRPPASDLSGTDPPPPPPTQVTSKLTSEPARKQSVSDMDTDSDSEASDRPELSIFVEWVGHTSLTWILLL